MTERRFLFIEPFFGGSHRDFAKGWVAHSRHRIELLTLPARFWKWRMRGAALYLVRRLPALDRFDGLITTDLMSLSDFKSLSPQKCPPTLVYFHENQLTYPLAPGERMDYQFGFTDITTALAADRVVFNSHTHFDDFFDRLPAFIAMMPEFHPNWVVDAIRIKATVNYPGCRFAADSKPLPTPTTPPLIIWNHRWEHDKNPQDFFDALDAVTARGIAFRLALLGENFQAVPKPFISAKQRFGDQILRYGHEPNRSAYLSWLRQGAVIVSTAHQENFGISVIEAIRHGCWPVLPRRLAYPELIPQPFHERVFYNDQQGLIDQLCRVLTRLDRWTTERNALSAAMAKFSWETRIAGFDDLLEQMIA